MRITKFALPGLPRTEIGPELPGSTIRGSSFACRVAVAALQLAIALTLTGRIHADGNEGITVPHKVDPKPSWVFTGSSQSPSPAVRGTPVTITWNFTATNGKHRDPYLQGDPPPNPKSLANWGIQGKGPLQGDSVSFSMTCEATARQGLVNFWDLGQAWYWDPCDNSRVVGSGAPFPSHEFSLRPADPNDPRVDDPNNPDGPGPFDPDDPTVKDPEDPEDPDEPFVPQEKPDQGEVDLLHEFLDISSFQFVPYRGYVPKRSDSYLAIKKTDKTNPDMIGVNDLSLELTHRIVTINSPAPRDLEGVLKLEVNAGNPQDYEVFHYNSETHQSEPITLPFQMHVTEPGHSGGGVHDFHAGYEGFTFRRVGNGPLELKVTVDPDEGDSFKMAMLHLLPMEINVDANNDGAIAIGESASMVKPYEIWPNDDDDEHSPNPPQRKDTTTSVVDGVQDLKDFFPLFLNIKQLVTALPPSATVKYKLMQADSAISIVQTNLTRSSAFSYRSNALTTGFGPSLVQASNSATTEQITQAGLELSAAFLNNIRDHNGGVILVEGRAASTEPLVLIVEKQGVEMGRALLPLSNRARIVLLLHGMNSNTTTWDALVTAQFGNPATTGAANVKARVIQSSTAPLMTANGVRCYRLQFGAYDPFSARVGLEGVTAASTPGYLADTDLKRCGDFQTFAELGQEVDDAMDALLDPTTHPENKHAQILLMGHSRGGIAARVFLQGSSTYRNDVIGLLTTGSPHQGSPMGRIYSWLDTHKRGAAGTDSDDWEVVDLLITKGLDVRRPVIGDLASLTTLNAAVASLPTSIRYAEIVYQKYSLGHLSRTVNYTVFDEPGINIGDQMSAAAETYILGAGHTPASFPGDGLIPGPNQRFTSLPGFRGVLIPPYIDTTNYVLHVEEPGKVADLGSQLHLMAPNWFP